MSKEKHVLNITSRDATGKGPVGRLRREGKIPAVIYSKGKEGEMVSLELGEWRSLMQEDVHLVHLIENGKEKCVALIKAVQENFLNGTVTHIDFQKVDMKEAIVSVCSIHSHGTAKGESQGGILEQVLHEIEVEAKPDNLPESLEVDVTNVDMETPLLAKDIVLPAGVTLVTDAELVVFHMAKAAAEVSATAAEATEAAAE